MVHGIASYLPHTWATTLTKSGDDGELVLCEDVVIDDNSMYVPGVARPLSRSAFGLL